MQMSTISRYLVTSSLDTNDNIGSTILIMNWNILEIGNTAFDENGAPRYEQLARRIEQFIRENEISPGERLPTVRDFSRLLKVSATTVSSAFELLERKGVIRAEVGRGTFVGEAPQSAPQTIPDAGLAYFRARLRTPMPALAWRRRALMSLSSRLRAAHPGTVDCSTGRPDPALLPFPIIQRAWKRSMQNVVARDLQYAGPEPIAPLREQLVKRLSDDGIPVRNQDLLICDSAQQSFGLMIEVLANQSGQGKITVAVEEPGYPTMLDTLERAGLQLTGLTMDEFGVVPASLDSALRAGASAVFLTPRAQNPTGASWSPERRLSLAEVLAAHPHVLVLEDDQFAEVAGSHPGSHPGSLLADLRLEDRVVYVRSFSKSIAPDLRIAAIAARPVLLDMLFDAKRFADGWTAHLIQNVLSNILLDDELDPALKEVRTIYNERRHKAAEAANRLLTPAGGGTWAGADGVNIWVHLPAGTDAREVIERTAVAGVLLADGEPFYLSPGNHNVLRVNAGSVSSEMASRAGSILTDAALISSVADGPTYV